MFPHALRDTHSSHCELLFCLILCTTPFSLRSLDARCELSLLISTEGHAGRATLKCHARSHPAQSTAPYLTCREMHLNHPPSANSSIAHGLHATEKTFPYQFSCFWTEPIEHRRKFTPLAKSHSLTVSPPEIVVRRPIPSGFTQWS
jgi:hypothetical protein